MDNIFKHKAEKYKYKYLKLKQELEGGSIDNKASFFDDDGNNICLYNLPITTFHHYKDRIMINDTISDSIIIEDSNLPGQIKQKLNIKIDRYIHNSPDPNVQSSQFDDFCKYNKEGYIGKILNYNHYNKIFQTLNELRENNINLIYINILLACRIYKEKRNILNKLSSKNLILTIFPNCEKMFKTSANDSPYFGYIISSNKSIDGNISEIFIINLIDAIKNFIVPLHEAGYVLNNIDVNNILWDENKVYFNIEKMTKNTDNNIDFISLKYYIINLFNSFNLSIKYRFMHRIYNLTYNNFMSELNNIHKIYNIYKYYNDELRNRIIFYNNTKNKIIKLYKKSEFEYEYHNIDRGMGNFKSYKDIVPKSKYKIEKNNELVKKQLDESHESGELKYLKALCKEILDDCIAEENKILGTDHIITETDLDIALNDVITTK